MRRVLEEIGLNRKEASVYLAMLELGQTTISRIAQKSKIKRTSVYDVLPTLKERGLMGTTTKNGKKFYFAEDPRVILEMLKNKEDLFRSSLPSLLAISNFLDHKPKVRFFEGEGGIKKVYEETLEEKNSIIMAWTGESFIRNNFSGSFSKEYVKKRLERSIIIKAITPHTEKMSVFAETAPKELRKVKMVDLKKFPQFKDFSLMIYLFHNRKIAFISHDENIALIIESEKAFQSLKMIFEFMWESISE